MSLIASPPHAAPEEREHRPTRRTVVGVGRRLLARLILLGVAIMAAPTYAEDWLQWGGPNGDFTVDVQGLADTWPAAGPKQLWKRPLGDGYSAILYKAGELFTVCRDGDTGVVTALDARTGGTKWEHRYLRTLFADMTENFGTGPNSTPLIVDDRLIAISVDARVRCLDVATGKLLWEHNLPSEFGRQKRVEEYGYSGIPLRYKNHIIVQVGGDEHSVVAFNPDNGSIVWKAGPGNISYAAPAVVKLGGRDQYVYFEPEGVVGLDPSTGKTLWKSPIEFANGNHLTPVIRCDDKHLWVQSQFNSGGGRVLEITHSSETFHAKQKWFNAKLRGSCWTSIRLGDFIYGSVGGHDVSFLTAFNWKTGDIAWRKRGYHMAQCLYADGKLIFLDRDGKLSIAKVSPEGLDVLSSATVTEPVSWTVPTLAGKTLYVRDREHILALILSSDANP
ncbi:MAG: PQQ-like beta-propeller repeat protein [Phycisphaerae bacterium]|jgi:outer membrane protein assembly factor BamB